MTTSRALLPVALVLALSFSPRLNAGAGFNDGDFSTYNWAPWLLQDTTAGQTASFAAGEQLTGGFGTAAYRSNSFSFHFNGSSTNQGIIIGNLSSNVAYNPSVSGPIHAITGFGLAASNSVSGGAATVSIGLLLMQTDVGLQTNIYYTNQLQSTSGAWNQVKEQSLQLAADFARVGSSGPVNPDFTTNGGAIEFGYVTAASLSSGSATIVTGTLGVDDFQLSISNTPSMARFTSQQAANLTSLSVTLSGLAPGETITWLVSTNLVSWSTNNPHPTSAAANTNGAFTVTNSAYPAAPSWFLRALVQ
ncbi:MAG TPA: hypothetical protein VN765_11260 [Candidatus Acidoferrum sp.]|nr:hypothetical protein [Candidatus Acidoferrum sp.]